MTRQVDEQDGQALAIPKTGQEAPIRQKDKPPLSESWVTRLFSRVSDPTAIRVGRVVGVISMVASVASAVIFVALGEFGFWYEEWGMHNAAGGFLFGLVAFVVVPRQPRNGAVWAVAWSGLFQAVPQALAAAITGWLVVDRLGAEALEVYETLSDLPSEIVFVAWFNVWSWIPALGLWLTFGFLLFPDGRLPTRRWRIVAWLAAISIAGASAGFMTVPVNQNTVQGADFPILAALFFPVLGISVLMSVASLFFRYRRAAGDQRHQLRWVAYAAILFGVAAVVTFAVDVVLLENATLSLNQPATLLLMPVLIGAYAVAVLKYRLYDIDVVISKSFTYLGLAVAITLVYAAVVVVPLLIVGIPDEGGPGLALPLAATALVAVLFEPIRARMQRWANRVVYGKRSTPHEVLSQLIARLGGTAESRTDELASLLAQGTGADEAVVWLLIGERLHPNGVWPPDRSAVLRPVRADTLSNDDSSAATSVQHGDDILGALSITKPRNDPVTPADTDLLGDIAASAGLVLRNISLNSQLEERARQVRASRQRLIAAQDAERHRLERDLHDGAQQQVVALKVKLGLAKTIAEREGAEQLASLVAGLADETQEAVDAMRDVAHGIYPPLLEAEGLEPALGAIRRSAAIPVEINVVGIARHSRQLEETVYFCVLEIINQTSMAGAGEVEVSLKPVTEGLEVVANYDATARPPVLTALVDRVDAAEGTFEVGPTEDGTRIRTTLPVRQLEPA